VSSQYEFFKKPGIRMSSLTPSQRQVINRKNEEEDAISKRAAFAIVSKDSSLF
jgi:hypothetical protein